jgi:hypothetical protein
MPMSKEDLDALGTALGPLIKSTVESLVKPIADNQKVIADTLAALPPAKKEDAAAAKVGDAKPLGAEDVSKIVTEAIKADRTAQAQASATSEKKTAARNKVIEAKGLKEFDAILLAGLPDTDDEAALGAAADKVAAASNARGMKLAANVGGAAKDGGITPGKETAAAPKQIGSGMTDGQQALASSIKMPA